MANKTDRNVKDFIRNVRKKFKIEKAIFFGSRSRGDHFLNSDYDIILVSKDFEGIFFTKRTAMMYDYWGSPLNLEAFCYTPAEFEKKKRQIGIIKSAVESGIEI